MLHGGDPRGGVQTLDTVTEYKYASAQGWVSGVEQPAALGVWSARWGRP
jgi:hypothetical protein